MVNSTILANVKLYLHKLNVTIPQIFPYEDNSVDFFTQPLRGRRLFSPCYGWLKDDFQYQISFHGWDSKSGWKSIVHLPLHTFFQFRFLFLLDIEHLSLQKFYGSMIEHSDYFELLIFEGLFFMFTHLLISSNDTKLLFFAEIHLFH